MAHANQFGDTTLTKVFVGGLAWETPKEAMHEHFDKFGDILEAVVISDKITGRSKGYGFVTFKEAEAAKKACEDATPMINGRRANCNLASLGARKPRSGATSPSNVGPRSTSAHGKWYYPTAATPFHPRQHHQAVPFYGYTPTTYVAADAGYNQKLGYNYMNGQFTQGYTWQAMMGAGALMPMYPLYQYHHTQTMGLPAHISPPTTAGHISTVPATISKPPFIAPNPVCVTVE